MASVQTGDAHSQSESQNKPKPVTSQAESETFLKRETGITRLRGQPS